MEPENTPDYLSWGTMIQKAMEKDINNFPSKVLHAKTNNQGNFHNLKGPAVITETAVYFADNGKDWTQEQYEKYIKKQTRKLHPDIQTSLYPITHLINIIHTTNNWGPRKNLPQKNYLDVDIDFIQKLRTEIRKRNAQKP